MRTGIWVGARVAGGLAIAFGLLALVAISWYARGTDDATRLFELLQGVILGTLGWLYGTQGFEAARQQAIRESVGRRAAEQDSETVEEQLEELAGDLARLQSIVRALRARDDLRDKVNEEAKRVGS